MIFSGCNSSATTNVVGMSIKDAIAALPTLAAPGTRTVTENGVVVDESTIIKAGAQYVILPASGKMGA